MIYIAMQRTGYVLFRALVVSVVIKNIHYCCLTSFSLFKVLFGVLDQLLRRLDHLVV